MPILAFLILTSIKGVWVPRWSINDGIEILNVLDGRFNHIFLQVFALGETYFPSDFAISARKSDQWLYQFIEEAHRRNIQVSAWINLYYSWGYASKDNKSAHPVNRFPAWFVQDKDGRSIIDYSTNELERKWIEGYYLAPGNQQVEEHLLNIVCELVGRYPFDGVHFDYIRYPGPGFIYDPAIRSQFMRNYCLDPINADQDEFISRYGAHGCIDLQRKYQIYVANDLSSYVAFLTRKIKELKPNTFVSAAVKPNFISAREDYCQDWPAWLSMGAVDLVCLMSYGRHIERDVDKALKATANSDRIAVGIGVYLLTPEEVQAQVNMVRNKQCAGFVCFSYDQIKKNRAYLEAVR